MPATAAIDNETLDHLLSVVDEEHQYSAASSIRKGLQRQCKLRSARRNPSKLSGTGSIKNPRTEASETTQLCRSAASAEPAQNSDPARQTRFETSSLAIQSARSRAREASRRM